MIHRCSDDAAMMHVFLIWPMVLSQLLSLVLMVVPTVLLEPSEGTFPVLGSAAIPSDRRGSDAAVMPATSECGSWSILCQASAHGSTPNAFVTSVKYTTAPI